MARQSKAVIITRDIDQIAKKTGNLYQSITIISKRARQISTKTKEELHAKLAEFASTVDNLEEVFENKEQIEISKFYERMPKPATVAVEEFLKDKIMYRKPGEDENEDKNKEDKETRENKDTEEKGNREIGK